MTADLLRTCAGRLRADADGLTAAEGQLTNDNGAVIDRVIERLVEAAVQAEPEPAH